MTTRRYKLKRIATCAAVAVFLCLHALPSSATEIAAVFSSDTEPYALAFDGFSEKCPANYWKYDLSQPGVEEGRLISDIVGRKPDLILALGSRALRATEQSAGGIPVLFVMVLDYVDFPGSRAAGVSIRIDPGLAMEQYHNLFPGVRKIGLVYDPANSSHILKEASRSAEKNNMELIVRPVGDLSETLKAVRDLENEVDGWWLIPDRTTLTSETLEYVLRQSLESGTPVLAPSAKYVERGAHAAFVPDYGAIGKMAGAIGVRILKGESPSRAGTLYAADFRIVLNARTCREIEVSVNGSWGNRVEYVGR